MQIHIENFNVEFVVGNNVLEQKVGSINVPKIGDKWPGTEAPGEGAFYAGISLSTAGDRLVHLLLWDGAHDRRMEYEAAVKHAESVNPAMNSHLPTRHQAITLFDNLQDRVNQDYHHWIMNKTKSGKAAFLQYFSSGRQDFIHLSAESVVRAVSEIPL